MQSWTQYDVDSQTVRGMLHRPPADVPANGLGVLFLHGWSGCKLGPHRMFVNAARRLSAMGCVCLRIDFRGRGDSGGRARDATIRSMTDDACAGVRHLSDTPGVDTILLLGICSGGKVAISAATRDTGIAHLALWSAEGLAPLRQAGSQRRKRLHVLRQYAAKALRPQTWKKLLAGRTDLDLVRKAVRQDESADAGEQRDEARTLQAFRDYAGDVLFVYGGNDPETRSSADGYRDFCSTHHIAHRSHEIPDANHSFYSLAWEREVLDVTEAWVAERVATRGGAEGVV